METKNKITIITALVDIQDYGNHTEKKFADRNFDMYFNWLKEVLNIYADFCVFIDRNKHTEIKQNREHNPYGLELYHFNRENLHDNHYFSKIDHVIKNKLQVKRPKRPEMINPLYNSLMFSKIDFVKQISMENPFGATHFMWLDAGFCHGIKDSKHNWILCSNWPSVKQLDTMGDKMIVNQIRKFKANDFDDKSKYYRSHTTKISGGIWCGTRIAVKSYHKLFQKTVFETLSQNIMDDDQSLMYDCYKQQPNLFYPFKAHTMWSHNWQGLINFFR